MGLGQADSSMFNREAQLRAAEPGGGAAFAILPPGCGLSYRLVSVTLWRQAGPHTLGLCFSWSASPKVSSDL